MNNTKKRNWKRAISRIMDFFLNTSIVLLLTGVFIGTILALSLLIYDYGYSKGQLDYQRGVVQYQLTEDGYYKIYEERVKEDQDDRD